MTGYTFKCGHPLTKENSFRQGERVRCATCSREYARRYKAVEPTVEVVCEITEGSRNLLAAIKRDHPYVIEAARADRQRRKQVAA